MDETIKGWLLDMYQAELKEVSGNIANELCWELGAEDDTMHEENVRVLCEYESVLKDKIAELGGDEAAPQPQHRSDKLQDALDFLDRVERTGSLKGEKVDKAFREDVLIQRVQDFASALSEYIDKVGAASMDNQHGMTGGELLSLSTPGSALLKGLFEKYGEAREDAEFDDNEFISADADKVFSDYLNAYRFGE